MSESIVSLQHVDKWYGDNHVVKDMNLAELNRLAETILPMVHTDLSKGEITSILMSAPKVLGKTAEQMAVPDHNDQHCDFQYESDRLQNFLYG